MKKEQQPKPQPIPVDNPAMYGPKDEWTISNRVPVHEGEHVSLAFHRVEIVKIIRRELTYDLCKVRVLGPITRNRAEDQVSPPPFLKWKGEPYDTEGKFTHQVAPC